MGRLDSDNKDAEDAPASAPAATDDKSLAIADVTARLRGDRPEDEDHASPLHRLGKAKAASLHEDRAHSWSDAGKDDPYIDELALMDGREAEGRWLDSKVPDEAEVELDGDAPVDPPHSVLLVDEDSSGIVEGAEALAREDARAVHEQRARERAEVFKELRERRKAHDEEGE